MLHNFLTREKTHKGTKNNSNKQILSQKVLKNIQIVTNAWQFMLYCNGETDEGARAGGVHGIGAFGERDACMACRRNGRNKMRRAHRNRTHWTLRARWNSTESRTGGGYIEWWGGDLGGEFKVKGGDEETVETRITLLVTASCGVEQMKTMEATVMSELCGITFDGMYALEDEGVTLDVQALGI